MATEAAPRGRPPKNKGSQEPKSDVRVIEMVKTDRQLDNSRLMLYKQMGYTVKDEDYYWSLTGSQKEFEKRQLMYQQKGIDQATRKDPENFKGDYNDPDGATTIETARIPATIEQLLAGTSEESVDSDGYENP